MLIKRNKSQIATIIMFIMAVVFLFTLISMNIGRVAQKKTILDNITDSIGLQLASVLGSIANAAKHETEMYGDATEKCDINKYFIFAAILSLIAISGGITLTFIIGPGGPIIGALALKLIIGSVIGAGIGAGISAGTGVATQILAAKAAAEAVTQIKAKFKNLDSLQRIIETPVQGVLFALPEDSAMVTDTFDMDRDKSTQDEIPRFLKWYNLRLNSFPKAGVLVTNFYSDGFPPKDVYSPGIEAFFKDRSGQPRFYIEDDENLMAKKGEDAVRWCVDSNNDKQRELKLVPWFNNELRTMLTTMRQYGYGINFRYVGKDDFTINDSATNYYEMQAIDEWVRQLEEFENVIVRGLHNIDFDNAVGGLDEWLPFLRNDKNTNGLADDNDWYTNLGKWETRLDELVETLNTRKKNINDCVNTCTVKSWACCGSPICSWSCCGGEPPCGVKCPGEISDDGHCYPGITCATSTGGGRPCCSILPLEPYNQPKPHKAEDYCNYNIVDVYPNSDDDNDGVIDRKYNAIAILSAFRNDIPKIRELIARLYAEVETMHSQTYDRMHEAFYLWSDYVGGVSSEKQEVGHIVYVSVTGVNPAPQQQGGDGFKIPHLVPRVELVRTCLLLENGSGDFTLTVARFDEDTSRTGPLSKFWRFRFGKGGMTEDDANFVRLAAGAFANTIKNNIYYEPTTVVKGRLLGILRDYGMVSRIRVHYGPGETQRDQSSVPARDRNKDIYIMETSSRMP